MWLVSCPSALWLVNSLDGVFSTVPPFAKAASSVCSGIVKGAVCKFLILLKHKNTIICLQIFKKHAKLTYLFIWKTMLQSVILLWKCAFWAGMSVSVLVRETRPLLVYPIVFQHPLLPVGGKHSIFHFSHGSFQTKGVRASLWQSACASSLRRRDRVKKTLSKFF